LTDSILPSLKEEIKKTPNVIKYRMIIVPLPLLPKFLHDRQVEPKVWFFYPPENDYVLGICPIEKENE